MSPSRPVFEDEDEDRFAEDEDDSPLHHKATSLFEFHKQSTFWYTARVPNPTKSPVTVTSVEDSSIDTTKGGIIMRAARLVLAVSVALGLLTASPTPALSGVVDHTCADLGTIPESAIEQAKATLHIAYGHTSHGSQLISGMGTSGGAQLDAFMTAQGATPGLYLWNAGGSGGALDLRDTPFSGASDLGNPDRYAWESATRTYLAANPEVNVILWSWCGQASTTTDQIDIYLDLMEGLIADYPDVQFVFMTGHLDGSGPTGLLNLANEHIRDHCRIHDRILYDFADIESFDPEGLENYMEIDANDNCDYDSDGDGSRDRNWALDWQGAHTEGVDWWPSSAAHSQHLNGNLKGYAAWWLWATLAGWGRCLPAPTGLSALGDPVAGEVALAWTDTASDPNEDRFVIQRRVGAGAWDTEYATVGADVTAFTDTGLASGSYAYRVVARLDDDGTGEPCDSGPSNVATAVLASDPPAPPTGLAATLDGFAIDLTWVDQSDDEESFILERAVDWGAFELLATLPPDTESHTDAGLAPLHGYTYRVKARNSHGDSGYSNEASAYVAEGTTVLTLKQGVDGYDGCRDTYLNAAAPTLNYGGDLYNYVQDDPKQNFAVAFDLPEGLEGMTILEAKLVLYCWTVSAWQTDSYLDLYRINEDWVEGTADGAYQEGSASWNVRGGTDDWSTPGGTFDPAPVDSSLIPSQGYYPEFDVTDLVQAWADGALENHGLLLRNDSPVRAGIKASEYSEYGRPVLEITYTALPCVDTDGDGYGDPASGTCTHPGLDCDDGDPAVHPGAEEVCDNGVDDDCDGFVDADDDDCPAAFILDLHPSCSAGELTLDYTIGCPEPAVWANYLVLLAPAFQVVELWTVTLPAVDPPAEVPITFPVPDLGTVGIWTGLFTEGGTQGVDLEWVDTGL